MAISPVNPTPRRGAVDGSNNFWGAGSLVGNLLLPTRLSASKRSDPSVSSTRNVKIINGVLYFALQGGDSTSFAPGLYEFVDFNNHFQPLPEGSFAAPTNVLLFSAPIPRRRDGYDINPQGTIAYTGRTPIMAFSAYEKSGGSWRPVFAFGFTNNLGDGQNTGFFGLVVDWTSTNHPIVFATTTEGAGGSFTFSNRVVRLDDTNVTTAGFVTIAMSRLPLRWQRPGLARPTWCSAATPALLTPDLRPVGQSPLLPSVFPSSPRVTVGKFQRHRHHQLLHLDDISMVDQRRG